MADMGLAGLFTPPEETAPPAPVNPAPAPPAPPESAPQPEAPAPAEASTAPGEPPAGRFAQAWHMLRLAYYQGRRTWRDARNHPGGPIWKIEHFRPPSIADQATYRDGRGWVPDGWPSGWVESAGMAYHTWFAIPVLLLANCVIWVAHRPQHMLVFLLCAIFTAFLVWAGIHVGILPPL